MRIDGILSSQIVEGSYYPVNKRLVDDILHESGKIQEYFRHTNEFEKTLHIWKCAIGWIQFLI